MSKKVLVVDDSKSARREIVRIAQQCGLTTFEAENGRYALQLVKGRKDFSMIFCDINMPEMNGIEFLAALRQEAHYLDIPVIMVASEIQEEIKTQAKAYQVKAWINKPAGAEVLLQLLNQYCS